MYSRTIIAYKGDLQVLLLSPPGPPELPGQVHQGDGEPTTLRQYRAQSFLNILNLNINS
jgi:hypothetical protein